VQQRPYGRAENRMHAQKTVGTDVMLFGCDAYTRGPILQNILRDTYDYLTIMPKLRSTHDEYLIYKMSYDYRKINLQCVHGIKFTSVH